MTDKYLPAPAPYVGPYVDRCMQCLGRRVTGVRFRFDPSGGADPAAVLLVDELCPTCGGCGRRFHEGCEWREHTGWEPTEDPRLELDEDGLPADRQTCASCSGRGWFVVEGYPAGADLIHYLRVPCGCVTDQLVEAA